jgi:hypothetical protein
VRVPGLRAEHEGRADQVADAGQHEAHGEHDHRDGLEPPALARDRWRRCRGGDLLGRAEPLQHGPHAAALVDRGLDVLLDVRHQLRSARVR